MTQHELQQYLQTRFPKEDESVDWKNWQSLKQNISGRSGEDAVSYLSAIANMEGGHLVIGADDALQVVGIQDLESYTAENAKSRILGNCHNLPSEGLDIAEYITSDTNSRLWIIDIPKHLPRRPVTAHGKAWQRVGDSLCEMRPERHDAILREPLIGHDWSADICPDVTLESLGSTAISELKRRWSEKSGRPEFLSYSDSKALHALDLISPDGVTNAAVLLLGSEDLISKALPGAEILFEWRQDAGKTTHDYRAAWRKAFLIEYEEIWNTINARNLRVPFHEGLIQHEVFAFHEKSIREALMNAVAHRDYTKVDQSIFIKASPQAFLIESPGGFPPGVTIENVLDAHIWRNRRLMEVLEKIGMVERSGQGMDDIFGFTVADGKGFPDLTKSDDTAVRLSIPAVVIDPGFVKFVEQIINEKQVTLLPDDLFDLERIRMGEKPVDPSRVEQWAQLGIVEKVGKTSGMRFVLSHRYYKQERRLGVHTRLIGLSRDTKKALILEHLKRNARGSMSEFVEAFPDIKRSDITNLLQELRREKLIHYAGSVRKGYWMLNDKLSQN